MPRPSKRALVLARLRDVPVDHTMYEVAEAVGCSVNTATKHLQSLVASGDVMVVGFLSRKKLYRIVD